MPLLDHDREESLIERQAKAATAISKDVVFLRDLLLLKYNSLMRLFWKNPTLTPQQVANSLGTDATELFVFGEQLANLLISIDPAIEAELEVPLLPVTFNPDGTVTIVEPVE